MEAEKFNWLAFLFNSSYYAGKGNVKKGLIFSLFAWMPLFWIPIGIYCGKKANQELTSNSFSWPMAISVGAVQVVVGLIAFSLKK